MKQNYMGSHQRIFFNVYMGNGGLHGLDRKDFQNFHAYTEAKKEIEQGQFFTPAEICEFLVACVKPEPKDIIMI